MENPKHYDINDLVARYISVLFHPVFMPIFGLIIIFSAPTFFFYIPLKVKGILVLTLVTNNILIPVCLLPFFRHRNIISSWSIETRKDRIAPLVASSVFYLITSYIMMRLQIPLFIKAYVFSISMTVIFVTVVNFWWRISLHSVGAGAVTGIVIALSLGMNVPLTWFLLPVIIISGLILSARLKLNSHNIPEVFAGFFSGFAGMNLFMRMFL
jgi:hypothetical protein